MVRLAQMRVLAETRVLVVWRSCLFEQLMDHGDNNAWQFFWHESDPWWTLYYLSPPISTGALFFQEFKKGTLFTLTIVKSLMTLIWCSHCLDTLSYSHCSPCLSIVFTIPTTPLFLILAYPMSYFSHAWVLSMTSWLPTQSADPLSWAKPRSLLKCIPHSMLALVTSPPGTYTHHSPCSHLTAALITHCESDTATRPLLTRSPLRQMSWRGYRLASTLTQWLSSEIKLRGTYCIRLSI